MNLGGPQNRQFICNFSLQFSLMIVLFFFLEKILKDVKKEDPAGSRSSPSLLLHWAYTFVTQIQHLSGKKKKLCSSFYSHLKEVFRYFLSGCSLWDFCMYMTTRSWVQFCGHAATTEIDYAYNSGGTHTMQILNHALFTLALTVMSLCRMYW